MQNRHFEMIVRVIRELPKAEMYDGAWSVRVLRMDMLVNRLADEFQAANPRFNRDCFIAACNGEDATDSAGRTIRYSQDRNAGVRN